jgi:hypothetical protein
LDAFEAGAEVDVLHVDRRGVLAVVHDVRADVGYGPRGERDRLVARDARVGGQKLALAIHIREVDPEPAAASRHERDEELRL